MSFRGLLRPGQGTQRFRILRRVGSTSNTGRARTGELEPQGELMGSITEASPKEIAQFKQNGTPITHTILQRGTTQRAKAQDILELHSFEEVIETSAGCTICSHCGPNCLGVLFFKKA